MLIAWAREQVDAKGRNSRNPSRSATCRNRPLIRLLVELLEDRTLLTGPTITTAMLPTGITTQAYSTSLASTGGSGPVTWSVTSGNLPAGLSLNSATGAITGTPSAANFNSIADFTGTVGLDSALIMDSTGNFFGTASKGGPYGDGVVFEVPAGTNTATPLVTFDNINGAQPRGGVIEDSNGNLFGTTFSGGAYGYGTVYEVAAGTNALTTLVSFNQTDGGSPVGGLVEDNSGNLYGTTSAGGPVNDGTVFKVVPATGTLTTLVNLNDGTGGDSQAGLAMDSSGNLYGTTLLHGTYGEGTVFKVWAGTNTLTTLVNFNTTNGASPQANVILDNNGNLFGTTYGGGLGRVFEVAAGTQALTTLATFNSTNGAYPVAGLVLDGSGNLYGTTGYGGTFNDGTVFKVAAGTNTLITVVNFNGSNGNTPKASLMRDGSGNLFGTTYGGGAYGDGTLFKISAGSNSLTTLLSFNNGTCGAKPDAGLIEDSSGNLYGTTPMGGAYGNGSVFKVVAGTNTITTLASFNSSTGFWPFGGLVEDGIGNLYGTAAASGASNHGTIFKIAAGTNVVTTLVNFTNSNGGQPEAGLLMDSSGNLFGTTYVGGALGDGTVFEIAAGTNALTTLATFNNTNGKNPFGNLIEDSSGNLYGTTSNGGASGFGTVFKIAAGSNSITTLVSFNNTNGANPNAGLLIDGSGNLFGTTPYGGPLGGGTVFKVAAVTNALTTLVSFRNNVLDNFGINPYSGLVEDSSGDLFGITALGGDFGHGTVFKLAAGTNALTTLADLDGANGSNTQGTPLLDSSGNLFGISQDGGIADDGTIFKLNSDTFTIQATDATGASASQTFHITIYASPNITTTTLPDGSINQPYSQTIATTGTTGTVSFVVTAGSLPPGLVLNGVTGAITGTPSDTTGSPYNFAVTAIDSLDTTATQYYALTISLPPTTTSFTDNGPNPSTFGQAVNFTATVSGGSAIDGETVTIEDADNANAVVASPTLSNGSVTFTIADLTVGTHHLFAVYNGDANNASSNSSTSPVTQVVTATLSAPSVASVIVNGGTPRYTDGNGTHVSLAGQNSVVEQIVVTFNEPVTLDTNAFTISNNASAVTVLGGSATPNTADVLLNAPIPVPTSGGTQFILTFQPGPGTISIPGAGAAGTIIKDGVYTINTDGSKVHANGLTAADNHTGFWALYGSVAVDNTVSPNIGDGNSDILVDTPDAAQFKIAFGSENDSSLLPDQPYDAAMDSNLSGVIGTEDAAKFKHNFGAEWVF